MLLGRGALPTRREWECARRQAGELARSGRARPWPRLGLTSRERAGGGVEGTVRGWRYPRRVVFENWQGGWGELARSNSVGASTAAAGGDQEQRSSVGSINTNAREIGSCDTRIESVLHPLDGEPGFPTVCVVLEISPGTAPPRVRCVPRRRSLPRPTCQPARAATRALNTTRMRFMRRPAPPGGGGRDVRAPSFPLVPARRPMGVETQVVER